MNSEMSEVRLQILVLLAHFAFDHRRTDHDIAIQQFGFDRQLAGIRIHKRKYVSSVILAAKLFV